MITPEPELRDVGTEFEVLVRPEGIVTDLRPRVYRFRVSGHVEALGGQYEEVEYVGSRLAEDEAA